MRRQDVITYGAALLASAIAHVVLIGGLGRAAHAPFEALPRVVELAVLAPEPAPVDLRNKPLPRRVEPPPPNVSSGTARPEEAPPSFGISMASATATTGTGFSVRVGNTLMMEPEREPPAAVRDYAPVPLYEVNAAPKLKGGSCAALVALQRDYPQPAKDLGIEGRVALDVEIRSDGSVGEVSIARGVGHGLDEAAMSAIKRCAFEPAELRGRAVATRITYGITFVIEE
ncbi:MAG: TonB family protein [Deltaproteobacteria bacterium]|nr:TonB family protein [Deltaproteobacteria bacterium]